MSFVSASYSRFSMFLGINIPTTIITCVAIGGALTLRVRLSGEKHNAVFFFALSCSLALLVSQVLAFISYFIDDSPPISAITLFAQNIFPAFLWCLLFHIVLATSYPRLQFQGTAIQQKRSRWNLKLVYVETVIIVVANIALAVMWGINTSTGGLAMTVIIVLSMIFPFLFALSFFSMMHSGSHYQDVRSFRGSFMLVLFLYVSVTIGLIITVALSFSTYSMGYRYNLTYILYSVMVKIPGSLALAIIVIMFPKSWLRSLREQEIRSEMTPVHLQYEDDQNQTWNPNLLYDPSPNQGYVNIDPQTNNKPNAH